MNELLEKLLNTEVLTEEAKNELVGAIAKEIEDAKVVAVAEAVAEAKAEFAIKFADDKNLLAEAIDTKVTELLQGELAELKEDVERFRDLEAEFAQKIVEEKEKLAIQFKADLAELVENLDQFLEVRLSEEMTELKESIEEVKKLEKGRKIFEAFRAEFQAEFAVTDENAAKLAEAEQKLEKAKRILSEQKRELDKLARDKEMTKVLESLHGRSREVMAAILDKVSTEKLAEAYQTYIGRVLHESAPTVVDTATDQDDASASVLAESATTGEVTTKVVTGDKPVVESVEPVVAVDGETQKRLLKLQKMAGIR